MSDELLSVLTGLVVALTNVVVTALVLRVRRNLAPVAVFAGCIAMSELVALAIGAVCIERFYFWTATSMVGFIGIANFFVFGAVYKSVSLQMLGLLHSQPSGRADKALLIDAIARPCVEQRMELLVEMGQVGKSAEDTYFPTPKGLKTVARLHRLQRQLGISSSGLYGKT
jgi:hypothetical protein